MIHNRVFRITFLVSLFLQLSISESLAAYRAPVWSENGMAATPHTAATAAAVEILEAGGNAVDAVVAASFALAVVEQYHSGLGGGEFTLFRMAKDGKVRVLDARESAPLNATAGMFMNFETNKPKTQKYWLGGLAVGVPGSVAGKVELITKYGKLPLEEVIMPAYRLAKDGFKLDRVFASSIKRSADEFEEDADIAKVFLRNNQPLKRGQLLRQPALAKTLQKIGKDKGRSFYHGEMAKHISVACLAHGGIIEQNDMANYKLRWMEPITFRYRGYVIHSMPPPSSGGVCLAMIFNILDEFPLTYLGQGSAESFHLIASAFESAFADRSHWLGDPDYSDLPVKELISNEYTDNLRKNIDRFSRNPVSGPGNPRLKKPASNTSHISVIDSEGNMCSMTTSVNSSFGSKVFVPELGIFLNSTMVDFSIAPDEPDYYGLVGGTVNSIEPGKRPLSSMSPTLVTHQGKPLMAVGSVGGPRIITSVCQILINMIDYGNNIQAAVDAPRIHMQWKPDLLYIESEVAPEIVEKLNSMGWIMRQKPLWSLSQGVYKDSLDNHFHGASDARGVGSAGPAGDR